MKDFIIVGNGLSAHVLVNYFYRHQLSFTLIGTSGLSQCSRVAAGIWNPVVFKRMTKSWLAEELIKELLDFYRQCETQMGSSFLTQREIVKPFNEDQEKTLWQKKSKTDLVNFVDGVIHKEPLEELKQLKIPNQYGKVKSCGNLDVTCFIDASAEFFKSQLINENFDYKQLIVSENNVRYKNLEAKQIVFCEGHLVKHNPFFYWLPLKPAKGEVLTISSEDLHLKNIIFNKNGFILNTGKNTFKVGATYAWDKLNDDTTKKGLEELKQKLDQMMDGKYTILKQEAGVRPSSIDRRPIIGKHPVFPQLYVFNGLGSKGVMLAPYFAKKFVHFFLQNTSLPAEVDVNRFYNLYRE